MSLDLVPMNGNQLAWRYEGNADPFIDHDRAVKANLDQWILSIVEKNRYRCSGCGFTSYPSDDVPSGYMQAMPYSMNYDDRDIDNWGCVCPFCHAQRNAILFALSKQFKFVCCSMISQDDLSNFILPLLYISSDVEKTWFMEANDFYDELDKGHHNLVSLYPNIPSVHEDINVNITTYMMTLDAVMSPHQYRSRSLSVESVRLIPSRNAFRERAIYWGAELYKGFPNAGGDS